MSMAKIYLHGSGESGGGIMVDNVSHIWLHKSIIRAKDLVSWQTPVNQLLHQAPRSQASMCATNVAPSCSAMCLMNVSLKKCIHDDDKSHGEISTFG